MRPSINIALFLGFASSCGAPETPRSSVPSPSTPVGFGQAGQGTVKRIGDPAAVPLTGPRVSAKAGDWLLENGANVAVVSADGRVIDFGERGGRDEVTAIEPTLFLGFDAAHLETVSGEIVGDGHVLHVVRRMFEKPVLLHVFVSFDGDNLRVETSAAASGPLKGAVAVTLGEQIGWSNVPTWVGGQGFVRRGGVFSTQVIARDSQDIAYAVCSEGGPMLAQFDGGASGFFEAASTGETPQLVPREGATPRRVIAVSHARGSVGAAATKLPCGPFARGVPYRLPPGVPATAYLELAECPAPKRSFGPLLRFRANETATLPAGCYQVRLTAPGYETTPWVTADKLATLALAPAGELRFGVTDRATHKPLPARVLVRGANGTPDPDWGDEAIDGSALNVVYSGTGTGTRPLPAGSYVVTIGRGFEYTAVETELTVASGKPIDVHVELERVVDTHGFLSADLHLHAMPSPDAIQPLADRVRALVATGVEVGVATDHNKVTDYKPVIRELGLSGWLASVIGDEVTTRDPAWGHFNVFPLPAGAPPLVYEGVSPSTIFGAARAAGTLGRDTLVQVNHPRMSTIGYFDLVRFDRDDVKGFRERVPVADMSFDAIEVFNGDHYANIPKVEECMLDFYALLNAGVRVTATGNSDSHRLTFHEPGVPRNFVAMPSDDPAAFDEKAFVAAVRAGKVTVSSGPFIRFTANGKGVGESVPEGDVELTVEVDAPPWVDVDRVQILRRGEVAAEWTAPFPAGKPRVRVQVHQNLHAGDWVLAIARGSRPMTYLHRPNGTPFAFTNPIWVTGSPPGTP